MPVALRPKSAPSLERAPTAIAFATPTNEATTLRIYDVNGRLVRLLINREQLPPGTHQVVWDGRGERGQQVASGIYFYRLQVGDRELRRKLQVLR